MNPTEEELKLALQKANEIRDEIQATERRMAAVFGITEELLRSTVPEGVAVLDDDEFFRRRGEEGSYAFRVVTPRHVVDVDELHKFWPAVESILRDIRSCLLEYHGLPAGSRVTACTAPMVSIKREAYLLEIFAYTHCLAVIEKAPAEVTA